MGPRGPSERQGSVSDSAAPVFKKRRGILTGELLRGGAIDDSVIFDYRKSSTSESREATTP